MCVTVCVTVCAAVCVAMRVAVRLVVCVAVEILRSQFCGDLNLKSQLCSEFICQ